MLRSRVGLQTVRHVSHTMIVRTPRSMSASQHGALQVHRRRQSTWFQSFEDPIESWGERHEEQEKLSLVELLQLVRPEWKLITFALGCQLVTSSVTMLFPMVFGRLVDGLQTDAAEKTLKRITGGLTVVMSGAAAATAARVATMGLVGERIARRLRNTLFESLMKQEIEFFERGRSGELVNRLSADVTAVSKFLTDNLTRMVRSMVTTCTGISALFYLSPKLAVVCIAVLPAAAFLSNILGRQVRTLSEQVQEKLASTTQTAAEKIIALRTVRLFGAEHRETSKYGSRVQEAFSMGTNLARVEGIYTAANFLAANLTLASVLYIGGGMVINSEITVGTLTSICMYMVNLGFGVSNLANAYGQLLRAQGCGARVYSLIKRDPKSSTSTMLARGPGSYPPAAAGAGVPLVRFDQVSFGYTPSKRLLDRVSFEMFPGEITAVTGPSGSGKSTLLALVSRLYDPDAGSIEVSGVDVADWDIHRLRESVAVVPQEVVLFEGTIGDNIGYAYEGASRDDVVEAATEVGASRFVHGLSNGYDTWVGERGSNLSGGQKKLIGLARAVVRKPRLLVLDEALTGLDVKTERDVALAVRKLAHSGLGILLIAHGTGPSLQIADRVIALEELNGKGT